MTGLIHVGEALGGLDKFAGCLGNRDGQRLPDHFRQTVQRHHDFRDDEAVGRSARIERVLIDVQIKARVVSKDFYSRDTGNEGVSNRRRLDNYGMLAHSAGLPLLGVDIAPVASCMQQACGGNKNVKADRNFRFRSASSANNLNHLSRNNSRGSLANCRMTLKRSGLHAGGSAEAAWSRKYGGQLLPRFSATHNW